MTSLSNNLQTLGLTRNQTDVYLFLVRKGSAKAGEIIEATSFHRNIVYTALIELEKMKLITKLSVRGVALFRTLSPEQLVSMATARQQLAKTVAEELLALKKHTPRQEVVIHEGKEEFQRHAVRSFTNSSDKAVLRYLGVSPHWHNVVDQEIEKQMAQIQRSKKLVVKGIAIRPFLEIQPWLERSAVEIRYNSLIGNDTNNVEILEDRICIQSFNEPCLVVEIINIEMAENYKRYFDFLWEQSGT
jgi:sugar-specific transcriptional regulator TrmB